MKHINVWRLRKDQANGSYWGRCKSEIMKFHTFFYRTTTFKTENKDILLSSQLLPAIRSSTVFFIWPIPMRHHSRYRHLWDAVKIHKDIVRKMFGAKEPYSWHTGEGLWKLRTAIHLILRPPEETHFGTRTELELNHQAINSRSIGLTE